MKVISWNLLRLTGAEVEDVAALVTKEKPDLMLMQEATRHIETLPALVGGHFHRLSWLGRIHGLAAWSLHRFAAPRALSLPASRLPGRLPRRRAQLVQMNDITFANVHLSHGQLLNRRQLARIAAALRGKPSAIIGDFNMVGPVLLPGFSDVGPREPTHFASNVVPFRLDRCLTHGLACRTADALAFGPSDHRPIRLELSIAEGFGLEGGGLRARPEHRPMRRDRLRRLYR
ncbi:MAG: endonuclease/exonuclease/phosphatase family protein [Alphaproteobacteria bacterium]|nr:endonuclease/exonuclease/phosphatase family protein [Alphaproteobacteria bacterium]MBV8410870.1 endonuclease/exonuclease/phosphatase family protein [Alphaproteobacteria bacterium]